ncbi:MAG TPA: CRISPR-associated endonuclease Cas2 [Patescibacteria group bacterium]|nr:CRISPR-associated endonuclease Cas2 [Patescibacteria group bacterium]
MKDRDLYLAAYDIADDKRLRRALFLVKGYATGGQKSVFECFLTEAEKRRLLVNMDEILEDEEDRFALIRLDPRSTVHTLGIAVAPEDPPFFYYG